MKKFAVLTPFITALLSILIWRCEINTYVANREGAALFLSPYVWLSETLISPYIISFLASLSFIIPLWISHLFSTKKALLITLSVWLTNTIYFYTTYKILERIYTSVWHTGGISILDFWPLVIVSLAFSVVLWLVVLKTTGIKKTSTLILLIAVPFASFGLAQLAALFLHTYEPYTNVIDAGYPQFFGVFFLGLIAWLSCKKQPH